MTFIILIVIALAVWAVMTYNNFIRLMNRAREAWTDIDIQLKRRYDLAPNLVNAVKGTAGRETVACDSVTQALSAAMAATTPDERGKAENVLSTSLKSLFAVAETYNDLKTSAAFLEIERELNEAESKIQAFHGFYNGSVVAFNTAIDLFPSNIVAKAFKFDKAELFSLAEAETAAKKAA